jgi:hypothetical protein
MVDPPLVPPGGVPADAATSVMFLRLNPLLSNAATIDCRPAASVTGTDIVTQLCQPPVAGIVIGAETPLGALKATCMTPPPGEATRTCRE